MSFPRFFFPRSKRLTKKKEFDNVYSSKLIRRTNFFMCHVKENGLDRSRLGISVPKRVGNAIIRNMVRRRLRESFRQVHHELPQGYDLVVTVYKNENPTPQSLRTLLLSVVEEYDLQCKSK